jgi:hypothetical protein
MGVKALALVITKLRPENLNRRNHMTDLDVDGEINIKTILNADMSVWIGVIWLKIESRFGNFLSTSAAISLRRATNTDIKLIATKLIIEQLISFSNKTTISLKLSDTYKTHML